ncbi:MAG: glycoside hydrolase domain-containing protein [Pseudomonadota bacterium]
MPFGMVQFSPDTPTASPSGYRYSDTEIHQFSITHLDGAGCPNDEDLPILPMVGPFDASPGSNWGTYRQAVVRRIIDETFTTGPGGLPGNDDLGATSAWLVWAYLGLYPVIPGSDVLVFNGPTFPKATVHLACGGTLTIRADGAGGVYVQDLAVAGSDTTQTWLRYADLADGATLDFGMGAAASGWGAGAGDAPPSYGP